MTNTSPREALLSSADQKSWSTDADGPNIWLSYRGGITIAVTFPRNDPWEGDPIRAVIRINGIESVSREGDGVIEFVEFWLTALTDMVVILSTGTPATA